jgi:hypothetical protein
MEAYSMHSRLTILSLVALSLAAVRCGGSVVYDGPPPSGTTPDASAPDGSPPNEWLPDAAPPDAAMVPDAPYVVPPPKKIPPEHRPQPVACKPTPAPVAEAGVATCKTNADCASSVAGPLCFGGQCGFDACLADMDCAAGSVCVCANAFYGGNGYHGNICVPGNCRVDSDCGTGGFCVPSRGYCGVFEGYYCNTPADMCVDPKTDCPQQGGPQSCVYNPSVGHFACGTVSCNG